MAKTTKKKKKPTRFSIDLASAKIGEVSDEITKVQKYLTRFGYLDKVTATGKLDKTSSEALKTFQRSFGLRATGTLTKSTIEGLEAHRCGNIDSELAAAAGSAAATGPAEFTLRGCKYQKQVFTYRFVNGTGDIAGTGERAAVRRALATWAAALCISFVEKTSGNVDFRFGWFTGNHGDGSPFDGVGNTLAHAFYPPPCGGTHAGRCDFDDGENWSLTGAGSTIDLETVALHEIGHLLGLAHSSVPGSVMFPSYGGVRRALTQDELDGIRRLYPFICRRGDSGSSAGFVGGIDAVRHRTAQVITAVQTQAGTLKLIGWSVRANGSIIRTGDSGSQAGKASSISIARGSRYVTALRTSSGKLKLISWRVNNPGSAITRMGDSGNQAGTASMINNVAMRNNLFVTAVRTSGGRLKLISWRLNANGSLTRLGDSGNAAGKVREISCARLSSTRLVTAVRTQSGKLKLIHWRVTSAGAISRRGDSGNQAGDARLIRAAVDRFGKVVTAVKTSGDDLKLITWTVPSSGAIQRRGDSGGLAGEIVDQDITVSGDQVITAVRTKAGNLKVIAWSTNSAGAVSRIGDSDDLAGTASMITLNEPLSGNNPIITSVRTANSALKLISWRPVS